jgi:aminoglycoside phosphotransferase (APT) family kinase protein
MLGRVPQVAARFTSPAVLPVLSQACERAGLSSDGAELLRLGENAIYRLATSPVVVRIARSADRLVRVERELCVARWLADAGVPAVRVHEEIEQPLLVCGHPVSFWHAVTGGGPQPAYTDLARLLARFHALQHCPCKLVGFEPLRTSKSRLATSAGTDPCDRDFLCGRCADLTYQFHKLEFALPPGPIHGDAHTWNLLTDGGQVVLLGFGASAVGPREWDLLPTVIAVERYGLGEDQYQSFAKTYGFDVRGWPGYPVLREIREMTMTTRIMQNVGQSPAVAAEFALRVSSLRERDFKRAWNFF